MKSSYDKNRVSIIATGPVSTLGSGSVASNARRFLYSSLTDCAILAINSSMRKRVSGPSKSSSSCGSGAMSGGSGGPSGNYDHWDKWDKLGWVRISRISRIRLGPPPGTYPEKGVLILNTYPNGISYRIS